MTSSAINDVIIIGAGPAGLTAALYLARYHRAPLVLHDGASRALRIPTTHNAPGFPDGVDGPDLIARMTRHATEYGARIEEVEVIGIIRVDDGFALSRADGREERARAVILATGIRLVQVDLPVAVHERAIRTGVLRYCPICDGHEHSGQRIGVIGSDSNGAAEALFLRRYSDDITLMPLSHPELSPSHAAQMAEAGIRVKTGALDAIDPADDHVDVRLEGDAAPLRFDVLYPALGCRPRAELATQLGLAPADNGCLPSTTVRDSGIPGLFAAGDVIDGLDQISVAIGHGAMAATNAHNWLRKRDGECLRDSGQDGAERPTDRNPRPWDA